MMGTVSQFNTKIDVSYKRWDSLTTKVIEEDRKVQNQKLDKIKVNLIAVSYTHLTLPTIYSV